jgi:hypothetical protein
MRLHRGRSAAGETTMKRALASRGAVALAAAATLASCGGGVVPDPRGTSPDVRLQCGVNPCVPSDTLPTGSITALMFVVDDGTRTQAQAGFNTDGSIFHNVELEGDTLWLVDGGTQTRMALARGGAWDFFQNLLTLGQPYLADLAPQPATARTYEFQLRRAAGTVASQVTLPPPFTIASPGVDQVFAIGSRTVPITVTSPLDTGNFSTTFVCTDANGNQTSNRVPDGQSFSQVDTIGETFQFNVPAFLASLEFDQDVAPPAPVTRCDIVLHTVDSNAGALAPDFHAFSILQATQTRSVRFLLR